MNLGQLHTDIANALARGNSLATIIPGAVADAAEFLEQNYTFAYMEVFGRVVLDPEAVAPDEIDFPAGLRVKSFNFVRVSRPQTTITGEEFYDLVPISPEQMTARHFGNPGGYFLSGGNKIYLDSVVQQEMELQLYWNEYTDWPTDTNDTPALLSVGKGLLKAQSLLFLAQHLRDPRLADIYQSRRDEGLSTLLRAQEELKHKHRRYAMGSNVAGR